MKQIDLLSLPRGSDEYLEKLSKIMEEMAGAPKEYGVRQPGEKGAYEWAGRKIRTKKRKRTKMTTRSLLETETVG